MDLLSSLGDDGLVLGRSLLEWADNSPAENYTLLAACVGVTLLAGIMSGLTLGLMSLDITQLEVLIRGGTAQEKKHARRILPILSNAHHLLVTLLLCNAIAMSALPLFLDRLADPVTALLLSVTAVLFFGEIIPQAVCARYGLGIGARLSWFVRFLMTITSPLSWTLGKLLDLVLGANHGSMFRRQQLKALVDVHGEATGLGGKLSLDEIKVITGALDLNSKIAYRSMTPLDSVVMLSTDDWLDDEVLRALIDSGHSRIPVHRAGNRSDLVGILLVKELLQYKATKDVPVAALKLRSLPRLSAATPMYDCLKLFQTGRSHMAVLTQPAEDACSDDEDQAPSPNSMQQEVVEAQARRAIDEMLAEEGKVIVRHEQGHRHHEAAGSPGPTPGHEDTGGPSGVAHKQHHTGAAPGVAHGHQGKGGASGVAGSTSHVSFSTPPAESTQLVSDIAHAGPSLPQPIAAAAPSHDVGSSLTRDSISGGPQLSASQSQQPRSLSVIQAQLRAARLAGEGDAGSGEQGLGQPADVQPPADEFIIEYDDYETVAGASVAATEEEGEAASSEHADRPKRLKRSRVPRLAPPGQPIGILTLEDVIEELIRTEIVDETDIFVDNEHHVPVKQAVLAAALPDRLKAVVVNADLVKTFGRRSQSRTFAAGQYGGLTTPLLSAGHLDG